MTAKSKAVAPAPAIVIVPLIVDGHGMTDDVTQDRVTSYVPSARPSQVALAGVDIASTLMSAKSATKQDLTMFIAIPPFAAVPPQIPCHFGFTIYCNVLRRRAL